MALSKADGLAILTKYAASGDFADDFDPKIAEEACRVVGNAEALACWDRFSARLQSKQVTPPAQQRGADGMVTDPATGKRYNPDYEKIGDDGEVKVLFFAVDPAELPAELVADIDMLRELNRQAAELAKTVKERTVAAVAKIVPTPAGRHQVIGLRYENTAVGFARGEAPSGSRTNSKQRLSLAQIAAKVK